MINAGFWKCYMQMPPWANDIGSFKPCTQPLSYLDRQFASIVDEPEPEPLKIPKCLVSIVIANLAILDRHHTSFVHCLVLKEWHPNRSLTNIAIALMQSSCNYLRQFYEPSLLKLARVDTAGPWHHKNPVKFIWTIVVSAQTSSTFMFLFHVNESWTRTKSHQDFLRNVLVAPAAHHPQAPNRSSSLWCLSQSPWGSTSHKIFPQFKPLTAKFIFIIYEHIWHVLTNDINIFGLSFL